MPLLATLGAISNKGYTSGKKLSVVTGGSLTSDSTYYYRTFTSSGTLTVSGYALNADVVVFGAGGGGQSFNAGVAWGRGGAGGFLATSTTTFQPNSYSATIGQGGAGGTGNGGAVGTVGNASSLIGGSVSISANGGQGGNTTSSPNYSEYGLGNTNAGSAGFGGVGNTSTWGITPTKKGGGGSQGNPNFASRPGDDGANYGGGLSRSTQIINLPVANTGGGGQGGGNPNDGMPNANGQTGASGVVIIRYLKTAVE